MKLYQPLHIVAYWLGVFPVKRFEKPPHRGFRVHWLGLILKMFHTVLYWLVSLTVSVVTLQNLHNYQKKILTSRVLDIDELFVYMMFIGIAATTLCQAHMLMPSVARLMNDCFFDLCRLDDVTGVWQHLTAFAIVVFLLYEFIMYWLIITYKSVFLVRIRLLVQTYVQGRKVS